jgi:hypothetical protein
MSMDDFEQGIRRAVKLFWSTRKLQAARQAEGADADRGSRAAVTGGKQMDGFVEFVRELLVSAGCPESSIFSGSDLEMPGWFRAEKKWDLVIVHNKEFVGAIEFKSQIGPSFGNNFNNRTEEALGASTDIWAAYREGAFSPSPRPWLGYLFLLEDCEASRRPVGLRQPHFSAFPEFVDASYARRYELLITKLLRDRLYDGACLVLADRRDAASGKFAEPATELSFANFVQPLLARVHLLGMRS